MEKQFCLKKLMLILILYEENIEIIEANIIQKPKSNPTKPHVLKSKKYDWIKTKILKIIKARTYFFELFILFVCQDKIGAILINKKPGIIIGITVELK